MIIIPAIDLKEGRCVRLSQGDMDRATVYSDDPVATARQWQQMGAQRLHIVDLDGAVNGTPANTAVIDAIRAAVTMEIEVGGGIRDMDTATRYLSRGIDYIILGTAAIRDPALCRECCSAFPGRVIIGIDARDGMVAVQGWTEDTSLPVLDLARQFDPATVAALIYTDISRDGMLSGPNTEATAALARAVPIPVIASGGIATIDDIARLRTAGDGAIYGAITGRAIYTGSLDLAACIAMLARTAE